MDRFTFNASGTHRCDRCGTLFPYTECYACDLSHECADGWYDAADDWEHVYDDEEEMAYVLEDIRTSIRDESVSQGELILLASLAEYIAPGDVELLEWAGVPEFPEEES